MLLLEYTNYNKATIKDNFGAPEYSYWFVRKAFEPILGRLGERVDIKTPEREVDAIYLAARARGESCVFLPFCPPNTAPLDQVCPTVPVFAWEYDTLPNEVWNNDPREDWTYVLKQTGMAITHCSSAAAAIHRSMGRDFPVWTVPAPMFDRHKRAGGDARGWQAPSALSVDGGFAINVGDIDLTLFGPGQPKSQGVHALRVLEAAVQESGGKAQPPQIEGVVYTSVLNPYDGRKNWKDLIAGFVWAFRDTPTATLLIKLTRFDIEDGIMPVLQHLSTMGPFACRVVLVHGLLSNEAYGQLIGTTSYAVNAAYGEGQCLPLMEYMSAGRPAVAPRHTAMEDYVTPENAFIIRSEKVITHWPHDERTANRCHHNRISFTDLVRQFRESYRVARHEPGRYERMSAAAVESLRAFCSDEVILSRMSSMMKHVEALEKNR